MFAVLKLVLLLQLVSLPPQTDTFEVTAGYRTGVRDETTGSSGLAATAASFLFSTPSARALALTAYAAGGDFEFFADLDRTGFHVKVPMSAKPSVEQSVAQFFAETPEGNPALVDRAVANVKDRAAQTDSDFRARVEDEIRRALLGSHPYTHRPAGWKTDTAELSRKDLEQFFADNFGTDRAFVIVTGAPDPALSQIVSRSSRPVKPPRNDVFKAERSLRFPAELSAGAVILASPVPSVYYRGWYAVLLLDRLIQRMVPGKPSGSMAPALDPYYYRIEVPVAPGQFVDAAQESFLHEIERLQFVRATDRDLQDAKASAIEYLESAPVQHWFLSLGIPERRLEGVEWVRSFSADDMRATARDMLVANRVIASWPPKPKESGVSVESLNSSASSARSTTQRVNAGDLGALVLLKTILERKLIEEGFWNDVELTIDSSAAISIRSSSAGKSRVLAWTKDIAAQGPSDEQMNWARGAAVRRLDRIFPRIEPLMRQLDPQAAFPDLSTVSAAHVQDVARTYFQQ